MSEIPPSLCEIRRIGQGTKEFLIHPEHCPVLRQNSVFLAGISLATPDFRFVRHASPRGQILACFRGSGKVLIDGKWETCGAGHAYVTPPGHLHGYHGVNQWEVGWILYQDGHLGRGSPMIKKPMLVEMDPRPLEHVLRGLHQETSMQRDPAMLDHWGEILCRTGERILEIWRTSRLWRLWQKVQVNLAHDWTLPELAQLAGLGIEQLRRLCLREAGCSPMQQVTRLRMQHAVSLISSGYKIEVVARAVGYENAFAFSTAFRRLMGSPPSTYRNSGDKEDR
ncbi:MAG: AraC family transcriptional regulator [Opitutaceae bacterium]|jgi:AraC-like DNA-binding protein